MNLTKFPKQIEARLPSSVSDAAAAITPEITWTRAVAAGSLVASACLLFTGKRKAALAVAITGAAVAMLENPEAARELWQSIPGHLRTGQDFLMRAEEFVEDLAEKGNKFRTILTRS